MVLPVLWAESKVWEAVARSYVSNDEFCKPLVGSSNLSPGTTSQRVGRPYPDAKLFPVAADLDRSRDPCGHLLFCPANSLGSGAVWLASLRFSLQLSPSPAATEGDHVVGRPTPVLGASTRCPSRHRR